VNVREREREGERERQRERDREGTEWRNTKMRNLATNIAGLRHRDKARSLTRSLIKGKNRE